MENWRGILINAFIKLETFGYLKNNNNNFVVLKIMGSSIKAKYHLL